MLSTPETGMWSRFIHPTNERLTNVRLRSKRAVRELDDPDAQGRAGFLVKALVAIPGIGVAEGSIYPLLSRLKKQGLVSTRLEESSEGPARKYYRLTSSGRLVGEEMQAYFADMAKGVAGLGGRVDFTGVPTKEPTGQAGSGRGRVQPDKLP
jgi:Transcriptional regulator PadR-like family